MNRHVPFSNCLVVRLRKFHEIRAAFASFFGSVGLAIAGWAIPVAFPSVDPWITNAMLIIAVIFLVSALIFWFFGSGDNELKEASQASYGDNSPNLSGNFHGDVRINSPSTEVIEKPRRTLNRPDSEEFKKLLTSLPKNQTWKLESILGDEESQSFAIEIVDFLANNGFDVGHGRFESSISPPVYGVRIYNVYTDGKGRIIVGHHPK